MSERLFPPFPPVSDPPDAAAPQPVRRVTSLDLLGDGKEVLIQHGDQTYRLRVTAANKLILVK